MPIKQNPVMSLARSKRWKFGVIGDERNIFVPFAKKMNRWRDEQEYYLYNLLINCDNIYCRQHPLSVSFFILGRYRALTERPYAAA